MRSRIFLVVALIVIAPLLSACESFDMDKLDIFNLNEKKKLPGDRRAVFPEGVPGVNQGVPPELVKGFQPPPEAVQTEAAPEQNPAASEQKAKPKRKVRASQPNPQSAQ